MPKNNWKWAILLAGAQSLSAFAITPEAGANKPLPENYASYSLYLQALFDYQRAKDSAGNQLPPSVSGSIKPDKSESLDAAIAQAGSTTGYIDKSSKPRSTYKSFSLNQLPPQDMSQSNVGDSLGIFSSHIMQQQPQTTARLRPDNPLSLFSNEEAQLFADVSHITWQSQSKKAITDFSAKIILPEGEAEASASASIDDEEDALELTLSSRVQTNIYLIDRDGIPDSNNYRQAGAIAIQGFGLQIDDMATKIHTPLNSSGDTHLVLDVSSPNPILIDLSNSRFGSADAKNGAAELAFSSAEIGNISYFAKFGPNSVMTIAPGMSMNIRLDEPEGMVQPLATLNGKISDISIGDISILGRDTSSGGQNGIHIGKIRVSGLNLVNAALYANGEAIVMDMGSGIRNMSITMERVAIGAAGSNVFVGDFYTDNIGIANTRVSFASH